MGGEGIVMIGKTGDRRILRTPEGPVSFGWPLSGGIRSWSSPGAMDLFIGRCWDGLYLHRTERFEDREFAAPPIRITDRLPWLTMAAVMDWNRDGTDDLVISDGFGALHWFERADRDGTPFFEERGLARDPENGRPIFFPFRNDEHPTVHDLFGYEDPVIRGYAAPACPPGTRDLVAGDAGGNLWWLRDLRPEERFPAYAGAPHDIGDDEAKTPKSLRYLSKIGRAVAYPQTRLRDERGEPFVLGDGYDAGDSFRGGWARPSFYGDDLLVLCGTHRMRVLFLERVGTRSDDGCPVFRNRGPAEDFGVYEPYRLHYLHSKLFTFGHAGASPDEGLAVPLVDKMAVLRRANPGVKPPRFVFDRMITGKGVSTAGNNFTVVLEHKGSGRRYLLDNKSDNTWALRELAAGADGEPMLKHQEIPVRGPDGKPFRVEGVTDPQGGREFYGFNRAYFWDPDGRGGQDLVVGTDKGLLYLLRVSETSDAAAPFAFDPRGPLRDREGRALKCYNRACACGADLDGDGREDLVVGGVSYQLGIAEEPVPGGGVFRIMNFGEGPDGVPRLGEMTPLPLSGIDVPFRINTHVQLFAADLDGDGRKEIVIASQEDGFKGRIFRVDRENARLAYTGETMAPISIEENLLDLDGDGSFEWVFGGGESGVAHYWRTERLRGT
jgi:hypothetical protein